jgi:hypothetical protein
MVDIFRELQKVTREETGVHLGQVIITCPAFLNEQRDALRVAASEAGLRVLRIIDAPTAADIGEFHLFINSKKLVHANLEDGEDFDIGARGAALKGNMVIRDRILSPWSDVQSGNWEEAELDLPKAVYWWSVEPPEGELVPEMGTTTAFPIQEIVTRTEFPDFIVTKPQELTTTYTNITIKAPDAVTKYKAIVMLAKENSFGYAETSFVVRNPIFTATQNPPCIQTIDSTH